MGEYVVRIAEYLTSVEGVAAFAAVFVALQVFLKALGEFFEMVGNWGGQASKDNWLDSGGAFFRKLSNAIGVGLNYFSLGNKQR